MVGVVQGLWLNWWQLIKKELCGSALDKSKRPHLVFNSLSVDGCIGGGRGDFGHLVVVESVVVVILVSYGHIYIVAIYISRNASGNSKVLDAVIPTFIVMFDVMFDTPC